MWELGVEDRDSKGEDLPGLAIGGLSVSLLTTHEQNKDQVNLALGPSIPVSYEPPLASSALPHAGWWTAWACS